MARATSSLPVPLSPVISTQASRGATRAMRLKTVCMAGLRPTISSGGRRRSRSASAARSGVGAALQGAADGVEGLVQVERLGEVIEGPALDGPHRRRQVAERRHDDDRRVAASAGAAAPGRSGRPCPAGARRG